MKSQFENSFSNPGYRTDSRIYQVAKQQELCGTLLSESESRLKKELSDAKSRELSGHDIFAPPPKEVPLRPLAAQNFEKNDKDLGGITSRNLRTTVNLSQPTSGPNNFLFGEETVDKTSKKSHAQKVAELTGNGIFKDGIPPHERTPSEAKLREMSGNDIFAGRKAPSRDYLGGVRKPPGGESSVVLV